MKVKPNLEQPSKLSQALWIAAGLPSGKEGIEDMKPDADHDEMFAQVVIHNRRKNNALTLTLEQKTL